MNENNSEITTRDRVWNALLNHIVYTESGMSVDDLSDVSGVEKQTCAQVLNAASRLHVVRENFEVDGEWIPSMQTENQVKDRGLEELEMLVTMIHPPKPEHVVAYIDILYNLDRWIDIPDLGPAPVYALAQDDSITSSTVTVYYEDEDGNEQLGFKAYAMNPTQNVYALFIDMPPLEDTEFSFDSDGLWEKVDDHIEAWGDVAKRIEIDDPLQVFSQLEQEPLTG